MLGIVSMGGVTYCSSFNNGVKAAETEEVADVKLTKKVSYVVVHSGKTVKKELQM